MTQQVRQVTTIPASLDDVWAVVGDVGNVADWVPALEASRLEGDVRHARFAGGGDATERIVSRDDENRTYTYAYLQGPLALASYESTLTVGGRDGAAEVEWSAEFAAEDPTTEAELSTAIDGIYAAGLASLLTRFGG